jgi:transcriptional regulator GlxA family with amidase domain
LLQEQVRTHSREGSRAPSGLLAWQVRKVREYLDAHIAGRVESTASLTDIAQCCGFTDQAHLCHHFRRSMGDSPAAWRRARRGELI